MFDIGFWEMLLIGVVALVVIGPERLPAVARTLGTWTARVRRFVSTTRADIEREINSDELRQILDSKQGEIDELRNMLTETRANIENTLHKAEDDSSNYVVKSIDNDKKDDDEKQADNDNNNDIDHGKKENA